MYLLLPRKDQRELQEYRLRRSMSNLMKMILSQSAVVHLNLIRKTNLDLHPQTNQMRTMTFLKQKILTLLLQLKKLLLNPQQNKPPKKHLKKDLLQNLPPEKEDLQLRKKNLNQKTNQKSQKLMNLQLQLRVLQPRSPGEPEARLSSHLAARVVRPLRRLMSQWKMLKLTTQKRF